MYCYGYLKCACSLQKIGFTVSGILSCFWLAMGRRTSFQPLFRSCVSLPECFKSLTNSMIFSKFFGLFLNFMIFPEAGNPGKGIGVGTKLYKVYGKWTIDTTWSHGQQETENMYTWPQVKHTHLKFSIPFICCL